MTDDTPQQRKVVGELEVGESGWTTPSAITEQDPSMFHVDKRASVVETRDEDHPIAIARKQDGYHAESDERWTKGLAQFRVPSSELLRSFARPS